jgi:hypothetical protein
MRRLFVDTLWIILGLGVAGALVPLMIWSRGHHRQADLGYMSHRWVSEQRFTRTEEAQR